MVVLRLQRTGKVGQPYYRVVAIEKSRGPRGRSIEILGSYDPRGEKPKDKVQLDLGRVEHWLKVGAQPSETVASLIKGARKAQGEPAAKAA